MQNSWKRAALGACTATAVALTAGLAFAPAAQAATTPTGGLLGGVTSTVNGVTSGVTSTVNGVTTGVTNTVNGLTGTTTGTGNANTSTVTGATNAVTSTVTGLLNGLLNGSTPTSPVTVSTGNGTISVGVNGGSGTGVGVTLGSTGSGTGVTGTVTSGGGGGGGGGTTTTTTTDPGTPTSTGTSGGTSTSGSGGAVVTALKITTSVDTVFPKKDGYRDSVVLHVQGTTADGKAAPINGVVVVKKGATEVKRWTITSSDADLTWNGRKANKIVAGTYDITGVAVDATGNAVGAMDTVAVSNKKLVTSSQTFRSKSVEGTHVMVAKAKSGLKHGKVLLRLTTTATGVVGKQYLVYTHKGKSLKVLIQNGTHTTKAVAVPKSFTSYRISHTWKKGTVDLKSVVYKYKFKKLK